MQREEFSEMCKKLMSCGICKPICEYAAFVAEAEKDPSRAIRIIELCDKMYECIHEREERAGEIRRKHREAEQAIEYGTYGELVAELRKTKQEYAKLLERQGRFVAEVTRAAFGHADALTCVQIIESLAEMRKEAMAKND
ncbi:MAG: hypothetical protein GY820_39870 [Gammaproteobacteria bacterium]|nr:hypothetical protein [Gammaproteobacteria bacterium]